MVDLVSVESSMIAAAGYDPQASTLVVLFNNGKAYEYSEVPPEIYQGLMEAESKGSYMRANVIDVYPYQVFKGWQRKEE
jgi:hypothetical protein